VVGRRLAVITNDQGVDLVDTQIGRTDGTSAGEVTGGCFCCRFENLVDVASTLISDDGSARSSPRRWAAHRPARDGHAAAAALLR
jgi:G3E family GTPase